MNGAAKSTEVLFNFRAQINDLFQQLRLYLGLEITVVQHIQLSSQYGVLDLSGLFHILKKSKLTRVAVNLADLEC
ncbi:hypothetical protein ES707_13469 [subsurface metagenome]